jgi:hypothetical protein
MTYFLNDNPAPPSVPAPDQGEGPMNFFDGIGAGFRSAQLTTNANFRLQRETTKQRHQMGIEAASLMPPDLLNGIAGSRREGETTEAMIARMKLGELESLFYSAREQAKLDPEKWKDVPLSDKEITRRVDEKLQRELRDTQAALDMVGWAPGTAAFIGGMGGMMADVRQAPLLFVGFGSGSIVRMMINGAAINMAAEAATLPSQFAMADRLNIPDPKIGEQLAIAGAAGAAFGGVVGGAQRAITYWRGRNQLPPGTENPVDLETRIQDAEDAFLADEIPRPRQDDVETVTPEPIVEGQLVRKQYSDAPGLPPVEPGKVRFFHGGPPGSNLPSTGGGRWVSPDYVYARDYRSIDGKSDVFYVDMDANDPAVIAARSWDEVDEISNTNGVGLYRSFEVSEEIAGKMQKVSASVTPEPTPLAPDPITAGPIEPPASGAKLTVLGNDDLSSIGVDAETFQFKAGGDDAGVTDRLRGITTWEPDRSGVALVYEYADGSRVIVDGHQRLGLAKRLAAEGKPVEFAVRILREVDGVTVPQARARAALKNIGEGSGTPLDAAKVLRDLGVSADSLNLPPQSALVRQGEGISRLSDDAFGMVVNGNGTEAHGALVGRIIDDKALHADILRLVTRLKPKNAFEAESIVRQAKESGATIETQADLFGDTMVAQSLFLERARVLDLAVKRLKEDRATFNVLMERSGTITGAGNTLDAGANAKRFIESGELMQYVQRQANMKGPISEALTAAARTFKSGRKVGPAVDEFTEAVRSAISRGDLDGGAGRLGRGADELAAPPQTAEPVNLFDQPSLLDQPDTTSAPKADTAPAQARMTGTDLVQTGVAQSQRAEIDARAQQSRMGRLDQTRVEDDGGGLFGGGQSDMFTDTKTAKPILDQAAADLRDYSDQAGNPNLDLGEGARPLNDVMDELDAADDFANMLDLCGKGRA